MMKRRSGAAALAMAGSLAALSGPALAEDWTGFYLGGQLGRLDLEFPSPSAPSGGPLFDGAGSSYGVHAGYNQDLGDFVLGAEVSVDFPSVDIELTPSGNPAPREVDRFTVAKLRAGYDAGRFLPYAVIGYASEKYNDTSGPANDLTFDGMAYGLGVSYMASPNLIAGVEALWFDLDPNKASTSLSSEGTSVNLRLSYRF